MSFLHCALFEHCTGKRQKLDEETFSSFAFPACTLLKGFRNSAMNYDIIAYFSRFLKKRLESFRL